MHGPNQVHPGQPVGHHPQMNPGHHHHPQPQMHPGHHPQMPHH